jgi:ABC-type transport system involved in multi-copper enzyme maturation permease subunit
MSRILHLARREWLELARQPVMLAVVGGLIVAIAAFVLAAVGLLQLVSADPAGVESFEAWFPALGLGGVRLGEVVGLVVTLGNFLIFTQYLGIASVLAGHTVLHDRQTHALPYLLLAPITRLELLLGKVLGAIGLPTLLFWVVDAVTMGLVAAMPVSAGASAVLPPQPAWLVAWLVGAPAWALGVGVVCAIVSAVARDVRTAQQLVWFVLFFATFTAGYLLAGRLADGVLVQVVVAAMGGALALGGLAVGARVISRDLSE